jgi:glycosyltransferase involved in cell wall biosynthesis
MSKKVRVAHVITRLCKGGAQENTFHTVRLANTDRFEVDLISGPTFGDEGSIEETVADAGIPVLHEPRLLRRPAPLSDWLTLRRLTRRFQEGRYHIVHSHTSKAGFLARLAAERAGVPIVVHTPHGNIFHGYFSSPLTRLFVWMERHAARRTDRIIELTAGGVEEYLAEGIGQRDQFRVIFSGIDTEPYTKSIQRRNSTRESLSVDENTLLVGGVGRLETVKGFTYLVEAAQEVADKVPDVKFIVAGQGSLHKALSDQAAHLDDRFQWLGLREDVPAVMAALDILVVPSLNEGMGRILLEAGAAETPVVASKVGGIPDIVDDGETGLLVPPRDADAIARAIVELAKAPERRRLMGATARAKVTPNFSLENMVKQIEDLYEELLHEKCIDPR